MRDWVNAYNALTTVPDAHSKCELCQLLVSHWRLHVISEIMFYYLECPEFFFNSQISVHPSNSDVTADVFPSKNPPLTLSNRLIHDTLCDNSVPCFFPIISLIQSHCNMCACACLPISLLLGCELPEHEGCVYLSSSSCSQAQFSTESIYSIKCFLNVEWMKKW